jgi:hypothetical protein
MAALNAYTLSYAPHDAIGIVENKIANAPGSIDWRFRLDVAVVIQILMSNVLPPSFDAYHEQLHHEVVCMIFVVEVLQQET